MFFFLCFCNLLCTLRLWHISQHSHISTNCEAFHPSASSIFNNVIDEGQLISRQNLSPVCSIPRFIFLDYRNKFQPSQSTSRCVQGLISFMKAHGMYLKGRPFREGIRENSTLWWGLVIASGVAACGATDFVPELNRWLQIVEMETPVRKLSIICLPTSQSVHSSSYD